MHLKTQDGFAFDFSRLGTKTTALDSKDWISVVSLIQNSEDSSRFGIASTLYTPALH